MLIELWEKLRGYDKWVEVEAKLDSAALERTVRRRKGTRYHTYGFEQSLRWLDQQGQSRYARFNVPDDSPLLKMGGRESVSIRLNPANPDDCYCRDVVRSRIDAAWKVGRTLALSGVGVCLIVLLLNWLFPAK